MYGTSPAKQPSAYRAAPRTFVSSAPRCPGCDKSVYAAEQVLGPGGREYHRGCLVCIACKKTVQPGGFQEHEGDPYCKHCYAKHHGPKGVGYGGAMSGDYTDASLSRSPYSSPARSLPASYTSQAFGGIGGSDRNSPRYSSTTSYGATASTADGVPSPSRATSTAPQLPSRSSMESPMSVYRTSRLQDLEDERSRSRSVGIEGGMDFDDSTEEVRNGQQLQQPGTPNRRINANQQAEAPEFDEDDEPSTSHMQASPVRTRHISSNSASFRGSPLKHSLPTDHPPPPMPARPISPASSVGTSATASSESVGVGYKSNLGLLQKSSPDLCRRCQKAVYFAEQVLASGHKWHKRCLRCAECGKALDSHLQERDHLPYCKRCYDDKWGLKSQGFVL